MALDKVVARVSSDSARARYRRVNLYVRIRLALAFRKAAVREGFRVGDFARMLLMGGVTLRLLSLNEERLKQIHQANQLTQALGVGKKRSYASFRNPRRGSVWVAVWLPVGFLAFIDQYAKVRNEDRNSVLASFLQLGLLAYLRGTTRFLKATLDTTDLRSVPEAESP